MKVDLEVRILPYLILPLLVAFTLFGTYGGCNAKVKSDAPSNLQAEALDESSISLSWQDNSTDESNEDLFVIERKKEGDADWTEIATVAQDVTGFTDNGLEANTEYCYRVKARYPKGDSAYSDAVCTDTPPPTSVCVMPPLNTDFSNMLYFFVDQPNNILVGATSTGDNAIFAVGDIVTDPVVVGLGATVLGQDEAQITSATIEGIQFDAMGEAAREEEGGILQINGLIIGGTAFGVDIEGECIGVEPLDTTSEESMRQFIQNRSQTKGLDEDAPVNIIDFADKLLGNLD